MIELDTIDRRLLGLMQQDCSQSLDALSDAVALSRNATWRRVKRLEESGAIREKVALLDPEAIGLGLMVLISVRTRHHDAPWARRFLATVESFPQITGAWRTSGQTDYVLQARVRDVAAYDQLYRDLIARIDLEEVSASFVMEEIKSTTALPL